MATKHHQLGQSLVIDPVELLLTSHGLPAKLIQFLAQTIFNAILGGSTAAGLLPKEAVNDALYQKSGPSKMYCG